MYLLDTNVVCELRKSKPHGAVMAWINRVEETKIFLAAITLAEIQAGVELTRRQDAVKAREIEKWLDAVASSYQILTMDVPVCRDWARLMHGKPDQLFEDAMIAATARVHRLIVVTRNTRDFVRLRVPVLNPFTATRPEPSA
jgi:predicted nucleic acid-binding protein